MGILDDAIREHLELKRKHGAGDDDLERLEKEAFGPPTRPGDPEFEESDASGDQPAPDSGAPSGDQGAEADSGDERGAQGDWIEGESGGDDDRTPAEQARVEYAELGDTVDHPVVGHEPGTAEEPAAPSDTDEPVEAPESGIFDADEDFGDFELDLEDDEPQADPDGGRAEAEPPTVVEESDDLDFDLDLEDEPFDREEPSAEQRLPDTDAPDEPEPISEELSLSPEPGTGEHDREPATGDHDLESGASAAPETDQVPGEQARDFPETGEQALSEYPETGEHAADYPETGEQALEPGTGEQPAEPSTGEHAGGEQAEEESLLEETPDFLEDTPEGERLWFEQGKPKDFDFDE